MNAHEKRVYTVHSPITEKTRRATCEEVGCPAYLNGWRVRVDVLPPDMQHAARMSGRRFTEVVLDIDPDSGERYDPPATFLVFEAGQTCFAARLHTMPDRPELYLIGSNHLAPRARHRVSAQSWVDDFGEHAEKINDIIKRG